MGLCTPGKENRMHKGAKGTEQLVKKYKGVREGEAGEGE